MPLFCLNTYIWMAIYTLSFHLPFVIKKSEASIIFPPSDYSASEVDTEGHNIFFPRDYFTE